MSDSVRKRHHIATQLGATTIPSSHLTPSASVIIAQAGINRPTAGPTAVSAVSAEPGINRPTAGPTAVSAVSAEPGINRPTAGPTAVSTVRPLPIYMGQYGPIIDQTKT